MKKFFALILSFAVCLSLSLSPVNAVNEPEPMTEEEINGTVHYINTNR